MTTAMAPASYDEKRKAWVAPDLDKYEWGAVESGVFRKALFGPSDVVVIAGASTGAFATMARSFNVAHVVAIENRPDHLMMLKRNLEGRMGATVIDDDPVNALGHAIDTFKPNVVILNLGGRELEPPTVLTLGRDHPSVDLLCIRYGYSTQAELARSMGLDEMLRTWHLDTQLQWHHVEDTPITWPPVGACPIVFYTR